MKEKKTLNKTKDKIARSLIQLMKNRDFNEISIKIISKTAHINRSTYYRNFNSKEEILIYYLNQIMNEYLKEFQNNENKTFDNYLKIIFQSFYNHKSELLILVKEKKIYLLQGVLNEFFKNIIIDNKNNTSESYKIYYHIGGIYNFTIFWLERNMKDSPEELSKIAISILTEEMKPLLKNKIKDNKI